MSLKSYFSLPYLILYSIILNIVYYVLPVPPVVLRSLWMGVTVIAVLKYWRYRLNKLEKAIFIFAIYNLILFILGRLSRDLPFTEIGSTLLIALTFSAYGLLGGQGKIDSRFLVLSGILLLLVAIPTYIHDEREKLIQLSLNGYITEQTTINTSTLFLMFLPFSLAIRNKLVSIVTFSISLYFIIVSAKRGNIVAAILPAIMYVYMLYRSTDKSYFKRLLLIGLLIMIFSYASDAIMQNNYLQSRFKQTMEGNLSGRDIIYSSLWNMWYYNADPFQHIFGMGYYGTRIYGPDGRFAHQDWLEILIDFGIVGVILYIIVFYRFAQIILSEKYMTCRFVLVSIFIIWLCKATVSMGFTDQRLAIMAIPYGYAIYRKYKR